MNQKNGFPYPVFGVYPACELRGYEHRRLVTTANPVPQNQNKFISAGPLLRTLHCDARALRAPIGLLIRLRCLHGKAKLRLDVDFETFEL